MRNFVIVGTKRTGSSALGELSNGWSLYTRWHRKLVLAEHSSTVCRRITDGISGDLATRCLGYRRLFGVSHRGGVPLSAVRTSPAGVAIAWDLRLLHSGLEHVVSSPLLGWSLRRLLLRLSGYPALFAVRREMWRLHTSDDRLALFYAFRWPNAYSRMHLRRLWERQRTLGVTYRPPASVVLSVLKQAGITGLDIGGIVSGTGTGTESSPASPALSA